MLTPGRPKNSSLSTVSATSNVVTSIATNRRPASHEPGVASVANGRATRSNNPFNGWAPKRSRASKIADFDGNFPGPATPDSAHASPSVINAITASYEPSECRAIPIAKYAITRAGKDRDVSSVQSQPTITSSTHQAETPASKQTNRRQIRQTSRRFRLPPPSTRDSPNYTHVRNPN